MLNPTGCQRLCPIPNISTLRDILHQRLLGVCLSSWAGVPVMSNHASQVLHCVDMLHCCRPGCSRYLLSIQAGPPLHCGWLRLLSHFRDLHGHGHFGESQCYLGISDLPWDCTFPGIERPCDRCTTECSSGPDVRGLSISDFQFKSDFDCLAPLLVV